MKYIVTFIIFTIFIYGTYKLLFFRFKPKKSPELYEIPLAHRGFHMFHPENTLEAYADAIKANMGIEIDIRRLSDGNIICFHDRYTFRLLQVPGKIKHFDTNKIKKLFLKDSNCKVPTLIETLNLVDGKVPLLIEVKEKITKNYLRNICSIVENYTQNKQYSYGVYFHTKSIFNYFWLKRVFPKRVFYILNPFRMRMKFLKGFDYRREKNKYNELRSSLDIQIPSPDDIAEILTQKIQELEEKKEILSTIGKVINNYETRVYKDHWVNKTLWLHRGIVSSKYAEHSREAFEACIKFSVRKKIRITVEFDLMLYKGEVRCYHKDKIPSLLGQDKSCAEKNKLESSLTLKEILDIFSGYEDYVCLALDIKDYRINNRILEWLIINDLENSNFKGNFICMSYNPLVLNFFKEVRPDYLRAQIGHSLSGLRKVPFFRFPWLLNGILGILFDIGNADCCLFDNSNWIFWMIAYHWNIKGKPVLIYAAKSYIEIEGFVGKESIANFIIEDAENNKAWQEEYLGKFKISK